MSYVIVVSSIKSVISRNRFKLKTHYFPRVKNSAVIAIGKIISNNSKISAQVDVVQFTLISLFCRVTLQHIHTESDSLLMAFQYTSVLFLKHQRLSSYLNDRALIWCVKEFYQIF